MAAVTRKTDRGLPTYRDEADSDTFVLAGAEDLVPAVVERDDGEWVPDVVETADAVVRRYRPRTEGAFARIERWTDRATGGVHWRTVDRDNVTSVFGRGAGARIADPADGGRVFSWLLEERADDRGNVVAFEYKAEDREGVDPASPYERHRLASPTAFANRYLKRSSTETPCRSRRAAGASRWCWTTASTPTTPRRPPRSAPGRPGPTPSPRTAPASRCARTASAGGC
jgi:hypothetical protein